jgi:hypothetical protein
MSIARDEWSKIDYLHDPVWKCLDEYSETRGIMEGRMKSAYANWRASRHWKRSYSSTEMDKHTIYAQGTNDWRVLVDL